MSEFPQNWLRPCEEELVTLFKKVSAGYQAKFDVKEQQDEFDKEFGAHEREMTEFFYMCLKTRAQCASMGMKIKSFLPGEETQEDCRALLCHHSWMYQGFRYNIKGDAVDDPRYGLICHIKAFTREADID